MYDGGVRASEHSQYIGLPGRIMHQLWDVQRSMPTRRLRAGRTRHAAGANRAGGCVHGVRCVPTQLPDRRALRGQRRGLRRSDDQRRTAWTKRADVRRTRTGLLRLNPNLSAR